MKTTFPSVGQKLISRGPIRAITKYVHASIKLMQENKLQHLGGQTPLDVQQQSHRAVDVLCVITSICDQP